MNLYVHRMLGHYLMDDLEEGNDLGGGEDAVEVEAEGEGSEPEEELEPEDEVVVTIGDEPLEPEEEEAKAAPQWVKDLRKERREDKKRIRELEAKLQTSQPKEPQVETAGKKPSLSDPEIDYDEDKYAAAIDTWYARKRKEDDAQAAKQREVEQQQKDWQAKLDAYQGAKGGLKVKDFDDAEEVVLGSLEQNQQGIIVAYADNPAIVVYALGKNPKEMAKLAAIKDPIKFALAMRDLEKNMKVQSRKPATQPERTVTGTAPKSGAVDNQLERLRAEAEKSGDYSKVTAYKKAQKEKQRAKG